MQIKNTSNFEVQYNIYLKRDGPKNHNRINPFNVNPSQITLNANEESDVYITFLPDHESYLYSDILSIETNNKVVV